MIFIPNLLFMIPMLYYIDTKKPYNKKLQATWRLECELGMILDSQCPVDGGWSPWGSWSSCHGTCDDIGHRKRTRFCINPPPSQDGLPCDGFDEQNEPCYKKNCSVDDFRKIIAGDPGRNEALRQLEAVPILMERCLQMECPLEAIEASLAVDNTWQLNPEILWNALQCAKHDIGCPVAGEWGTWGAWSACGARCGKGFRWKLRRCDSPSPSVSHLVCSGRPLQFEECEGDQCAIDGRYTEHDIIGTWSEWSNWTKCSENCGPGIKRRIRTCIEKPTPSAAVPWGTHCRGQHDQLEICNNEKCFLNGGLSGWSTWGPCSQSCGAGKRSRTRSCTRPLPSGGGLNCIGPKIEIGSCHLTPCDVYSHVVALFNGDSALLYSFPRKSSTFFHFYIRFLPLSPRGTLVRRGPIQDPLVRLSLHKWHVCLDARGDSTSCKLPRICSPAVIEPATWHSILLTVTSDVATLRINDAQVSLRTSFPCDPELRDDTMNIIIGDRFHGEVQEIILNFIPLDIFIEPERKRIHSDFFPYSVSNMAYEKGNMEEAFLTLENGQYLRIPCFDNQEEWNIGITLKSKLDSGTILILFGDGDYWFYIILLNMRIKMGIIHTEFKSETSSSTETLPGQWLDISLAKKRNTNAIEANINAGERLHVLLPDASIQYRRTEPELQHVNKKFNQPKNYSFRPICTRNFFIGGFPLDVKHSNLVDFTPFAGVIASLNVNNKLFDLHDHTIERDKDGKVQVSSRTASISGSYHEIFWGDSKQLNLTCLHARNYKAPNMAHWLFLDTVFDKELNQKTVRSMDDGKVLRLVVTTNNDLRGFYTCRAYMNKRKKNIITYGVLGKVQYKLIGPDITTIIAVFTTLSLVLFTIGWLVVEGYYDIRNGYGFYRDIHITPEDDDIKDCNSCSPNINVTDYDNTTKEYETNTLHNETLFDNPTNYMTQECQLKNTMKEVSGALEGCTSCELEDLPALPYDKSLDIEPSHQKYRFEPSYVSSPRHGSNITSPGTKLTSSSLDTSPRVLCSHLLMSKHMHFSRESLSSKKKWNRIGNDDFKKKSNLLTIKSSTFVNLSPVQKILHKFRELKEDDP